MASYRQRGKNKTWDYRVFDNQGKVIASNSGFKTKREATIEAQEIERKLFQSNKMFRFDKKVTLYELWKEWFDLIIFPSEKGKSTKNGYYYRGQAIKNYFSEKPIAEIRHNDYQSFLNEYGKHVTKDYLSRINSDIRTVIKYSQRNGLMLTDFTDGAKIFANDPGDINDKYLHSISDYKKLLFYLKSKFNYKKSVIPFLLYFIFKTGFRVGEAMALCWTDIDFEKKVIRTYRRYAGDRQEFVGPKTKTSVREIPVDDDLLFVLLLLFEEQSKLLFNQDEKPDLVFYNIQYKIPTNGGLNKYLKKCLKILNIGSQNMTATAGRHTYGSYLLAKGVDIWIVARILGHKDIQQIIKTYGHVLQEKIDQEYILVRECMLD